MLLSERVDAFFNALIAKTEHQNELLIGKCQSDVRLTSTQEHILMLLKDGKLTNTDLAKELSISQAAVSKAVKQLVQKNLVASVKDGKDGRVSYLTLTEEGAPIATEHAEHHQSTLQVYETILAQFSEMDQEVIDRFVDELSRKVL
ncbi:zinc-dependent MarR family transcriptional regulator [Streptococcus thoraltensis]|uniref:zinc-dependent MarR family transcriptional regulator n=1 Tax=Streptococcus thoraltensis TaxID=55085 RepID=UPI000360D2A8|nr:zinc-dependent MarR family transcriptional regulator [Streptococcus thoraltensis]MDY4761582.1 zinc-dependent MarR family transcriptional regulator [Streptococcus thoraltensis]